MNRNLFTQSIRDFNRCSLYKGASDTWVKTNKIIKKGFDYENFKTFQSNTNFYSIIGIEAHPSLTFNNFKEKKIFDSLKLIFKFNESSIICLMTCKGFFGMINEFTKLMSFL